MQFSRQFRNRAGDRCPSWRVLLAIASSAPGDRRDHVHEGFGRFAALQRQIGNFL
jgi:hypothetical protein